MTVQADNNHNVYILGAGFSRGAGLPLMSDFLNRMRDASDWLRTNGRIEESLAIDRLLEFRREASAASDRIKVDVENIEELFSLASASQSDDFSQISFDVVNSITATLDYCREIYRSKVPMVAVSYVHGHPNVPKHWRQIGGAAIGPQESRTSNVFPITEWIAGVLSGRFVQEGSARKYGDNIHQRDRKRNETCHRRLFDASY